MRALLETPLIAHDEVSPPRLRPVTLAGSKARVHLPPYPGSPVRTVATILGSDVLAQVIAIGGSIYLATMLFPAMEVSWLASAWPVFPVLTAVFALWGLYPGVGIHPAEEIRRSTIVISGIFGVVVLTVYAAGLLDPRSLAVFGLAWLLLVLLVPALRALVRYQFSRQDWWGYPVVVLGAGVAGRRMVSTLRRTPTLGLRPVAILDDDPKLAGESLSGTPVLGGFHLAPDLAVHRNVPYLIVAMNAAGSSELNSVIDRYARYFKKLLVVPDLMDVGTMWASSRAFEGVLGFEMGHYRVHPISMYMKRAVDFVGALLGLALLLPVGVLVAAIMKLDSAGPVFFRQLRMGRDGRCFEVYKFRSMYIDAEQKLQDVLNGNPEFRFEFETFHKLRDDPRVTRIGKILRRYSLDELPQLWNVLKGDMSLVGPRAYLPAELSCMQGCERMILKNAPGITGLWQVSGRNDVCFKTRIEMDVQYVRNWSVWLDIYIVARTLPVVLTGRGAS